MSIGNEQKIAFRHDMAIRLIDAGLKNSLEIKHIVQDLEQFVFMQGSETVGSDVASLSDDENRINLLKQHMEGKKGAGIAYDEAIKAKSSNLEKCLKIVRKDFLRVQLIANTGLSAGTIESKS